MPTDRIHDRIRMCMHVYAWSFGGMPAGVHGRLSRATC